MEDGPVDRRDDESLVAAVADGDRTALRTLYDRHAPWLLLRLSRRCRDPGLVDEVIQDTFMAVWRRPGGYRKTGEVPAWIWGIGVRRLMDRLRGRRLPVRAALGRVGVDVAEERVLLGVEYGDLAGALNRLSPELRAVLQATVLDGLSTYSLEDFADTLRRIAEGELGDLSPLITDTVDLGGVPGAFDALADPGRHAKILIAP